MIDKHSIVKSDRKPLKSLRRLYWWLHGFSLPAPKVIFVPLLAIFLAWRTAYYFCKRVFICEPLFKAYCKQVGRRVRTGIFLHWIQGTGDIVVGDDVLLDGKSSIHFAARYSARPSLVIGDRTFIGHNCVFVVGERIEIGRHCLLSAEVVIRDCDGHPLDPTARAAGKPAAPEDVRPVIVGDNVWIGNRVTILKGVQIGNNSVVGTGAIVTKDVPANVVVAGNPARVVKHLSSRSLFPGTLIDTETINPHIEVGSTADE